MPSNNYDNDKKPKTYDKLLKANRFKLILLVVILVIVYGIGSDDQAHQPERRDPSYSYRATLYDEPKWNKPSKFNPRPKLVQQNSNSQIGWMGTTSGYPDPVGMSMIKKMMSHAWNNYVIYAWGADELLPVSKGRRQWNGDHTIGATIVDSLDTLWIMGFTDEFEKAKDWVLNELNFDIPAQVSVFETNIRVVGGLLSAYELSQDRRFVDKAVEIADRLLPAFDSPTGIPYGTVNLKTGLAQHQTWSSGSILAEYGSMQLEFQFLSDVTGNPKYAEKTLSVLEYIMKKSKPIPGLFPTTINNQNGEWVQGVYTVGALSDSFYEYLLKLWLISGKADENYREWFEESAQAIKKYLYRKAEENGYWYVGSGSETFVSDDMEHLTCFAGGMFALGAMTKKSDPQWQEMLWMGGNLTETCYKMYQSQPLGIGAERTKISTWTPIVKYYILRPEVVESIFYMWRLTHDEKYRVWGLEIASSIEKYCKVDSGYAGIHNIVQNPPEYNNNQESFFLAETLKYLYLLFTDDSVISIEEFVFNTEAHPFRMKPFRIQ